MKKCPRCQLTSERIDECEYCGLVYEEIELQEKIKSSLKKFIKISFDGDKNMGTKQMLGLIGSIVLFVGVFTPVVSMPIIGNMNYFQYGKGEGAIVLVLAIVSFSLVLSKKFKGLWYTGLGSIAVMIFSFINFQMKMSDAKAQMEPELEGNPFRVLADMAIQSVQLQWGWALLIVGAALVIASAAIKEEVQQNR